MATEKRKGKIVDFGEKIGFARKDMYGMSLQILNSLSVEGKKNYARKEFVWPALSLDRCIHLADNGADPIALYWQREIRNLCFICPKLHPRDTDEKISQACENYVSQMGEFRSLVESVLHKNDIYAFYERFYGREPIDRAIRFRDILSNGELFSSAYRLSSMERKCAEKNFPSHTGEKKHRKPSFIPVQLSEIVREGEDYRLGKNVDADMWQETFNFRGVEFGNWLSQKDRQFSMNYAYDALMDLASVLDIRNEDIAFGGKLALAFGSRGIGGASAHYEPLREVINLTKMSGAGNTAHMWFHAFDDRLAKWCGITDGKFATETKQKSLLPESFRNLLSSLKTDADGNETDFHRGSVVMDGCYRKDSHGAWSSYTEMAARAFACYVKDTLGCRSDYLLAQADAYEFEYEDQHICAYPQGEEREILNGLFDQLFFELKEIGFFTPRPEESLFEEPEELFKDESPNENGIPVFVSSFPEAKLETLPGGQLRFVI